MQPGFSIIDHPSDVGIEARGNTLEEVFVFAASGLMSLILDSSALGAGETRKVLLSASDREQLLVRWLGEILYLYDGQSFAARDFSIQEMSDVSLRAEIRGETISPGHHGMKLDVKAVTYHQLAFHQDEKGVSVRVFLDI